jgi:maleylacetoacetate isomerase
MRPTLLLYSYWRSSSSHRVRIALAVKGLAYEYAAVDLLKGDQSTDAHKARSPAGYIPCLVVDGVAYAESVAIVELLEERFPEPHLYPRDAHGRARVRALVEMVNAGIQPMQNLSVQVRVSSDPEAQKGWTKHFIERGFDAIERAMNANAGEGVAGRYAYGDSLSAADVFLVPQVFAARRYQVDLARYPRIHGAFEAAMQLDAVKAASPENQPDAKTNAGP